MRVLMTADTIGGVWSYAIDLTQALARHDVEVTLLTMGAPLSAIQRHQADALRNLTLYESRYRLEWMHEPGADLRAAEEWMLRISARVRPDVVHLNGYTHAVLPWGVPVMVVAHSCVFSWWEAVHGTRPPVPEWEPYHTWVSTGLAAADVVVAPTRAMLNALERHYQVRPPALVIPNGHMLECCPQPERDSLIITAGRAWDEAKNIVALDAIANRLPWRIYLAGPEIGPDGQGQRLPHLEHLGVLSRTELYNWFFRTAIYASPALYEPFGLSILEAAMKGCALVLGDIDSLRELWDGCALFVPPHDHDALRAALQRLIDDADERQALASSALRRSMGLSTEAMAVRYMRIYQRLTKGLPPDEDDAVLPLSDL